MLSKVNIAFLVIDYSVVGGVEKVTSNLSYLFRENGINTNHLISIYAANKKPLIDYDSSLKIHVLNPKNKNEVTQRVADILKNNNIKKLIFQGDNMSFSLAILEAAEMSNCSANLHYHGSPYAYLSKYIFKEDLIKNPILIFKLLWSKIVYPFKKSKLKKVVKKANGKIICVSNGAKNELKSILKLPLQISDSIITIYNPINFKDDGNPDNKLNLISFTSRLTPRHKNAMMVVKVWSLLAKKYPSWTLQIIGDGPLKNDMEKHFIENKIDNVVFTGLVNNVLTFIAKSKIALSTSHCEGLPLAITEAAFYNNALIATKSDGGIIDIVKNDYNGILVEKNNVREMALAVEKLIKDSKLRNLYAENAKKSVLDLAHQDIIELWKQTLTN